MLAALLGWTGSIGTFAAYLLISRGRLTTESRTYLTTNIVGGVLGAVASVLYQAWPSVAANVMWALVALSTLFVNHHQALSSVAPIQAGAGLDRPSPAPAAPDNAVSGVVTAA